MKVIALTFNEGNGRRKIQRPSLIDCTEELPDDCICFPHKTHDSARRKIDERWLSGKTFQRENGF